MEKNASLEKVSVASGGTHRLHFNPWTDGVALAPEEFSMPDLPHPKNISGISLPYSVSEQTLCKLIHHPF